MKQMTNETYIATCLAEILQYGTKVAWTGMGEVECQTYREAGREYGAQEGIVIRLADGSEYSLTVVKSYAPEPTRGA